MLNLCDDDTDPDAEKVIEVQDVTCTIGIRKDLFPERCEGQALNESPLLVIPYTKDVKKRKCTFQEDSAEDTIEKQTLQLPNSPRVVGNRTSSPLPGPSKKNHPSQDAELPQNSGSELESSDNEDDIDDTYYFNDIRQTTRQMREVVILQEEGQLEAVENILHSEGVDASNIQYGMEDVYEDFTTDRSAASAENGPRVLVEYVGDERVYAESNVEMSVEIDNVHVESNMDQINITNPDLGASPTGPSLQNESRSQSKHISQAKNPFSWSDDFSKFSGKEEKYTRVAGSHIASNLPIDIFLSIWDKEILTEIAEQTNLYAMQTITKISEHGPLSKNLESWTETTAEEILTFFAIMMLMALNQRGSIAEYWNTGILGMPKFRQIMSRNRFSMLLRFLHFSDNDISPAGMSSYQKKIAKIEPILSHLNEKFASIYTPERELSLDETLLLWKGRRSWVQCIRSKAARFGMKSFELCEASTGYLIRSIIYAGKNSSFVEGNIHGFDNTTAEVVLELLDGFLDVGHMVVMDNWYNQLRLARFLKQRHTDVLGTINRRREFVPEEIKRADNRRMERGQQIARHCGDIAMIAWKDLKLVTMISTCHGDQVIGKRKDFFLKPWSVDVYNKTMGGVDLKDAKLSSYKIERTRGRKWYIKLFARLLNVSILNSYIIHSKSVTPTIATQRAFRFALAESLLEINQPARVSRPLPSSISRVRNENPLARVDGIDHFPVFTEKVKFKHRFRYRRRGCKVCTIVGKRTEVKTMCKKCCVTLCIGKCWFDYHTLQNLGEVKKRQKKSDCY